MVGMFSESQGDRSVFQSPLYTSKTFKTFRTCLSSETLLDLPSHQVFYTLQNLSKHGAHTGQPAKQGVLLSTHQPTSCWSMAYFLFYSVVAHIQTFLFCTRNCLVLITKSLSLCQNSNSLSPPIEGRPGELKKSAQTLSSCQASVQGDPREKVHSIFPCRELTFTCIRGRASVSQ